MPTTYAIPNGRTVMDATVYAGDGTSPKSQTNTAGFKPDLVWIKDRTNAYSHNIYDSVRGTGSSKDLQSDNTNSESTNATNAAAYGYLSAFNSNGFSTTNGTDPTYPSIWVNASSNNYVAWQWQAGQGTTSSNTNGSITSTVSVNATAGFSVVTYTGNGTTGATVGHGLGATPSFFVVKDRSSAVGWINYHISIGNTNYLQFNTNSGSNTSVNAWNNTSPTSSVFTVAGASTATNSSGENYVAYCWAPVAGYSAFGSFTTDGSGNAFIYTGFRPAFFLTKRTDSTSNWEIVDSKRSPYNAAANTLFADLSNAESSSYPVDLLSNGVHITASSGYASSATYVYVAFAENPFKYSLAR